MQTDYPKIISDLSSLFKKHLKIHIIKYMESMPVSTINHNQIWNIAISDAYWTLPCTFKEDVERNIFKVWNGEDVKQGREICDEVASLLANILTLIGYDVIVNNQNFDILEEEKYA